MKGWQITLIIIAAMAPALILPFTAQQLPEATESLWLVRLYPLYVVGAGVCARLCWPERRELTWILVVLLLLSHAAMYLLLRA